MTNFWQMKGKCFVLTKTKYCEFIMIWRESVLGRVFFCSNSQCGLAVVLLSVSFKVTTRVQPLLVQIRSSHWPSPGGGISPFLFSPSAAKQNLISDFQISQGATPSAVSGKATLTSPCVKRSCSAQGCKMKS